MIRFMTATAFGIALLGLAACNDGTAPQGSSEPVKQTSAAPEQGSLASASGAEGLSPRIPPAE